MNWLHYTFTMNVCGLHLLHLETIHLSCPKYLFTNLGDVTTVASFLSDPIKIDISVKLEKLNLWAGITVLINAGIDCSGDPFHKHVFLEHHLQSWCPPSGPIRWPISRLEVVVTFYSGISWSWCVLASRKTLTWVLPKKYRQSPGSKSILRGRRTRKS